MNLIEDKQEEILQILAEECAEVIVEVSKIKRFGNDYTALNKEIGDLIAMIEIMHENAMFNEEEMDEQRNKKREKLKKWSNIFKEN
jgi:NTP pyrophosphatase (non-canonical NTP hydrolase)